MTDLERFFRRLVANLAATDPARLHRPIPLDDIRAAIVPYRTNRRALPLDSSEDYELVLLRLCAGEGGCVRTEPEEARARFAEELASPNPDLDVLRRFENVLVSLRSEPLARALEPEPKPSAVRAAAGSTMPARPSSSSRHDRADDARRSTELEPRRRAEPDPTSPGTPALPLLRRRPARQTGRSSSARTAARARRVPVCPRCHGDWSRAGATA